MSSNFSSELFLAFVTTLYKRNIFIYLKKKTETLCNKEIKEKQEINYKLCKSICF